VARIIECDITQLPRMSKTKHPARWEKRARMWHGNIQSLGCLRRELRCARWAAQTHRPRKAIGKKERVGVKRCVKIYPAPRCRRGRKLDDARNCGGQPLQRTPTIPEKTSCKGVGREPPPCHKATFDIHLVLGKYLPTRPPTCLADIAPFRDAPSIIFGGRST
jgi:hypothetical protein